MLQVKFAEISEASAWKNYPDHFARLMEVIYINHAHAHFVWSNRDRFAIYKYS